MTTDLATLRAMAAMHRMEQRGALTGKPLPPRYAMAAAKLAAMGG